MFRALVVEQDEGLELFAAIDRRDAWMVFVSKFTDRSVRRIRSKSQHHSSSYPVPQHFSRPRKLRVVNEAVETH